MTVEASPDEAALHVAGGRRSGGAEEPERIAALLRPLLGGSGVLGGPGGGGVQVPGVRHVRPPVGRPEGGGRHAELEAHVVLPAVAAL